VDACLGYHAHAATRRFLACRNGERRRWAFEGAWRQATLARMPRYVPFDPSPTLSALHYMAPLCGRADATTVSRQKVWRREGGGTIGSLWRRTQTAASPGAAKDDA